MESEEVSWLLLSQDFDKQLNDLLQFAYNYKKNVLHLNAHAKSTRFRVGKECEQMGLVVSPKTLKPDSTISSPVIMIPEWVDLSMRMPWFLLGKAYWVITCLLIVTTALLYVRMPRVIGRKCA